MSLRKKLISNTIYLFLDWFVLTLMGFFYWLVAGKTLLPKEYGIVSTSVNLALVLAGISSLGLNIAIQKLVPEFVAKGERRKINSLIKFSIKIILLSSISFSLILFSFSSYISSFLNLPREAIIFASIAILIIPFYSQFGSIIYGFQNMKKFLTTDTFGQLVKTSLAALLIFLGFSYLGPLIGFLAGFLVTALLRFFSIPFERKYGKINERKILFDYAFPAFISTLAWIIFMNGQYVLLTALTNPRETGIFTVAMVLTSLIAVIPNTLTSGLFPIISQLSIDHSTKKKQSYLIRLVFRYAFLITLPVALFLIIFSKPVILIFSSEKYLEASALFPILAFASIIYGCGNIFLRNLYAIGKTKLNRNIVIVTTISFLIFAFPLISLFKAFGSALSYLLAVLILFSLSFSFIRKFLRISLPLKDMGKVLLASSIAFSFLYSTTYFTSGLLIGLFLSVIAAIIYLWILLSLNFYKKEDLRILEFFASKSPFFKKQLSLLLKFLSKRVK